MIKNNPMKNEEQREMRRKKSLELWSDPVYRKINIENKKGKKQTSEQIEKRIFPKFLQKKIEERFTHLIGS